MKAFNHEFKTRKCATALALLLALSGASGCAGNTSTELASNNPGTSQPDGGDNGGGDNGGGDNGGGDNGGG
ncbi:hypothetical protein, partial [Oceanimonas baumannii]